MLHIKDMSFEDLEFAVHITDKMDWNLTVDDFRFMKELEPEGCFVLFNDFERAGIATAFCFGKVGWFGNLIVDEKLRNKGAGSMLVEHSVRFLKNRNVETIGLYAYVEKIPFYQRLGFRYDSDFIVMDGKSLPTSIKLNLKKAQKENIKEIVDYDCSRFYPSRKKLLESILLNPANTCYMCMEDNKMVGYAAAKVYQGVAEIGPLVCEKGRNDIAINLLWANLERLEGFDVSACIPKKETAILSALRENGLSEEFRVARMFTGSPVAKNCIYVAESLERG